MKHTHKAVFAALVISGMGSFVNCAMASSTQHIDFTASGRDM